MKRVPYTIEFLFRASPAVVYQFLTSPACLTRWFCDEVDVSEDEVTFFWSGEGETAYILDDIEEELLRYRWEDADDDDEYLEFKIYQSPVTGETIMEITDFCDEDELDDQRQLWITQIEAMRKGMGG
ncbi:MAG: START-like domain-containing protein [Saprospiraceae bacterium]